jgi:hypothetical protein
MEIEARKYLEGLQGLHKKVCNGEIKPQDIDEKRGLIKGRVRVGSFLLEDNYYEAGDSPNVYAGVYLMPNGKIKYRKEGNSTAISFEGPFQSLRPIERTFFHKEGIFYPLNVEGISSSALDSLKDNFDELNRWIGRSTMFRKK